MQSLVQTNDKAIRLSFKDALAHKVEHSLTAPPPEPVKDSTIKTLLVPSNYEELSEVDLHFSLLHNKELKHSRETANLAVEIVTGKRVQPDNVHMSVIALKNPVEIPTFSKKTEVKRSPSRSILAPDSTEVRMQAERTKEEEFKNYISTLSTRTFNNEAVFHSPSEMVLRVPENYSEYSESELFHILTHTTELEHSRHSAYLAMDILSGKVKRPDNVTLQSVVLFRPMKQQQTPITKPKETIPAHVIENERSKREQFKQSLKTQAQAQEAGNTISIPENITLLLPNHYEELSEAGLFYTLTHNQELQHSHDSASLAVDILFNRIPQPESVVFMSVDVTAPVEEQKAIVASISDSDPLQGFIPQREISKREELKTYYAGQIDRALVSLNNVPQEVKVQTLLVPANYNELSQDELLYVLLNSTELAHTRNTAYLAMDILNGILEDSSVKLKAKTLTKPVERTVERVIEPKTEAAIHPLVAQQEMVKRAEHKAYLANQAERALQTLGQVDEIKTLFVPANYAELSQDELLYVLTRSTELAHSTKSAYLTMDILSGEVEAPGYKLKAKTLKKPIVEEAKRVVAAIKEIELHPLVQEQENAKRAEHKAYLAGKAERAIQSLGVTPTPTPTTLLVPANYAELSQDELLYVLTRSPELAHTRDSAYLALDILSGEVEVPGVKLKAKTVKKPVPKPVPERVIEPVKAASIHPSIEKGEIPKRQQFKQFLAEKAEKALSSKPIEDTTAAPRTILLPQGYEEMDEGELVFALIRNPEFQHTNDQAISTIDMLFGRKNKDNVEFKTLDVRNLQLAPSAKVAKLAKEAITASSASKPTVLARAELPMVLNPKEGERVILLPHNFDSMTETALHFALSHNREYGHSYESVYEALDIVAGRKACPKGTVFSTVEITNPVERAY